jgi:SAM-dependent methyltransferase
MTWGVWRVPERSLGLLGNPRDLDILELGCGAARWSIALSGEGARSVGLDFSSAQLAHATKLVRRSRRPVHLVRGDAEQLPFRGLSFDLVFCDWGAMTFCDPHRTVPEAARVLRPGGRFVFSTSSPFRTLLQNRRTDHLGRRLLYDYFGMHRVEYPDGEVNFQLPYGDWIRLFAESRLVVETLSETQPGPTTRSTYLSPSESRWARRWPLESIWRVRKSAE